MIHARPTRNAAGEFDVLHLSITKESIPNFVTMVNRALNCWDTAPKELKELGDILTHGYITQEYPEK